MNKKEELEVLVFVKSWEIDELLKKLNIKKEELQNLVKEINEELKNKPYFIQIDENQIYFTVKDEFFDLVKDYIKPNLSKDEIEILTMIVNDFPYSDILKKKGQKAKRLLEKLEKEGWIKIRKENRKYKFILTKKFKQHFKVK